MVNKLRLTIAITAITITIREGGGGGGGHLIQAVWFLRSPHHSPIFSFFVFLVSHSLYVVANGIKKELNK